MNEHKLSGGVIITEVVTRDGLQDESRTLPTDEKVRLIEGLVDAGVRSIEVTSFVHPRVVPQLADADELFARLPRRPNVRYSALLPNRKGMERAVAAGVDEVHLVVSASDSHNRANLNRTTEETLNQLQEVVRYAYNAAPAVTLVGTVATSFGCPFEGVVPAERLRRIIGTFLEMGMRQIVLADTTGMANPVQIRLTIAAVRSWFPGIELGLHLHNTRGMGLANAFAGLEAGVKRFESSLGGLGGCPFAPGASGNICTEDWVHMLHMMGVETGIDLDRLLKLGRTLEPLVGHVTESQVIKSGKSSDLHAFEEVQVARS
ncbi:MAG: hydroxymethylglutaryl-CoA lyase [Herpetosiphon sp.]